MRALQCQWVMDRYEQCGLEQGHDGNHVPYTPGEYLSLGPLLHPLDLWRIRFHRRCPLCGVPLTSWWCGGAEQVCQWEDGAGWVETPPESEWRFWPCRHEARQRWPWDAFRRGVSRRQ